MPGYATVQDVKDRVPERLLAQLTGATGHEVADGPIAAALADAGQVIDGYLAVLPAADRPAAAVLRPYALDIAIYALTRGRPGAEFEALRNRHTDAVAWLKWLAQGRFAASGQAATATGGGIDHYAPASVIAPGLEGF